MKRAILYFLFCLYCGYSMGQTTPEGQTKSKEVWIKVYKYEESPCDSQEPHDAPHALQAVLKNLNIPVRSSWRGQDGLMYPLNQKGRCMTLPTISIFEIPQDSYQKISALGFQACSTLEEKGGGCYPEFYSDRVLPDKNQEFRRIYKYAGVKQCQADSGVPLSLMEQELAQAQIVVFQRYKGVDGLLQALACGHETGHINVYVIDKAGLAKALSLGYRECAYLAERGGVCHLLSARHF